MGYDFVIECKTGKENVVADALCKKEEPGELLPRWLVTIQEEVAANSKFQKMMQNIQHGKVVGP